MPKNTNNWKIFPRKTAVLNRCNFFATFLCYTYAISTKGATKKIKVYLPNGYKIITVSVQDSIKAISEKYARWEYVL
jgi:hypothetical protein